MNKQITELKLEDMQDVVGGVIAQAASAPDRTMKIKTKRPL